MSKLDWKKITIIFGLMVLANLSLNKMGNKETFSQDNVRSQLDRFVEVFTYVKRFYVEPVESEKLVTGAIEGLLSELDPHSVYIPKKNLEKVTEEFEGYFEGIGIEFVVHNKILTVVSPIVGGPSEAVGLLPGDQIIRIEGESTYGIDESDVVKKLRGRKGSVVNVTIRRPGLSDPFKVAITRDRIPIYSVIASFMMEDKKTGYVYLGRFAKTTSEELEKALQELKAKGMENLILDLRSNSGGLLDQAIAVADQFIKGDQKLVYTKGRLRGTDEDFFSTNNDPYQDFPLIVMINHGSASASEIVAGAVQDLDRGLVVGQTSFGKGLVQNQIPLKDGSAMRLTIARYYTPSGRLIQRPYDEGLVDYYMDAYQEESEIEIDSTAVFYTQAGRKVYGGGGITPDIKLKDWRITRFSEQLRSKRIFFEFGSTFTSDHPNAFSSFARFQQEFFITQEMIQDLKTILQKHDLEFSQEAFDKDKVFIENMMKAEVARHYWDSQHYYQVRMQADPEVKETLGQISKAKEILQLSSRSVQN